MNNMVLPSALKELLTDEMQQTAVGKLCRKGEQVFAMGAQPQWMFYVVHGEVALERSAAHGDSVILQRCRQGFVSEASLMAEVYHCNAIALEETQLILLPVSRLRDALLADQSFAHRWMHTLNAEIMRLRTQCERLSLNSVQEKLVHLIQTEGKQGRYAVTTGVKTLASQLGVSHEALYRTMTEMKKQGVLDRVADELILKQARNRD